jgi:hypothetical protein
MVMQVIQPCPRRSDQTGDAPIPTCENTSPSVVSDYKVPPVIERSFPEDSRRGCGAARDNLHGHRGRRTDQCPSRTEDRVGGSSFGNRDQPEDGREVACNCSKTARAPTWATNGPPGRSIIQVCSTLPDGMTAVGRPPIRRLQFESRRGAPNPSTSSQFHSRRLALALDRAVDPESAACRPARGHAGDRVLFDDRAGKPGRAINGRREPPGAHVGGQLVSLGGDNQLRPGWSSTEAWSWTRLG